MLAGDEPGNVGHCSLHNMGLHSKCTAGGARGGKAARGSAARGAYGAVPFRLPADPDAVPPAVSASGPRFRPGHSHPADGAAAVQFPSPLACAAALDSLLGPRRRRQRPRAAAGHRAEVMQVCGVSGAAAWPHWNSNLQFICGGPCKTDLPALPASKWGLGTACRAAAARQPPHLGWRIRSALATAPLVKFWEHGFASSSAGGSVAAGGRQPCPTAALPQPEPSAATQRRQAWDSREHLQHTCGEQCGRRRQQRPARQR